MSPSGKSLGVSMWRLKRKGRHVANQYKPLRNETKKLTINISHRQMITINGNNDKDSNKREKKILGVTNSYLSYWILVVVYFKCHTVK